MPVWRSIGVSVAVSAAVLVAGNGQEPNGGTVVGLGSAVQAVPKAPVAPENPVAPETSAGGNVSATVPVASFGPSDSAPPTLAIGRHYPVTIMVWVAPGSGPATVDVTTNLGQLSSCGRTIVPAGVTRLRCTLSVMPADRKPAQESDRQPGLQKGQQLRISVSAHTRGGVVSRGYNHRVA